ncbi:transcription factor IBH1-like 1 [Lycium ferocissimum]|uniref:transcription factor IBH1-like 1 n=1 Tax=Lycium ferocissimum TaxID=112874 RepID=UPI002815748C|nr:transcription factor IBH1-like 1 [Lycium ferocissimum]XP_059288203.1 transcription factor IBH1-like 1 [Lycium ferocissimum]
MRNPSSLKQEFLKKWIKGLQICSATKKKMSIMERKNAIKLSADIAMASTRKSTTYWSHALMANASKDDTNKIIIENILGNDDDNSKRIIFKKTSMGISMSQKRIVRSKKIVRNSCKISRRARKISPSIIAKKLVKKRTQVLKNLVPGGEYMDDASLIKETLDYIISLRVQVDVMRHLANNASHEINDPKTSS